MFGYADSAQGHGLLIEQGGTTEKVSAAVRCLSSDMIPYRSYLAKGNGFRNWVLAPHKVTDLIILPYNRLHNDATPTSHRVIPLVNISQGL